MFYQIKRQNRLGVGGELLCEGILIIMSRIGQNPILIPEGVKVSLDDSAVKISGPNGSLEFNFRKEMIISQNDGLIMVKRVRKIESKNLYMVQRVK